MGRYTIKELPSGYWSVWCDGKWIEASLPTEQAAEKYVARFLSSAAVKTE